DRGSVAGDVGAHAEDASRLCLGDDRGVDVGFVGRGDRVPRAVEVAGAILPEVQRDSLHGLDGGRRRAGDDVNLCAAGDEQGQPALRDAAAPDHDDLLAAQPQTGEVRVVGHPTSLEAAAWATKRATAAGDAAGCVCRYDACTPLSTAPSLTLATAWPLYTHAGG